MIDATYSMMRAPVKSLSYVEFQDAVNAALLEVDTGYRSRFFAVQGQLAIRHEITYDTMITRAPWQDTSEHPALYNSLEVTLHGDQIDYMEERLGERLSVIVQLSEAVPYASIQRYELEAIERAISWVLLFVDMPALYDVVPDLRPRLSSAEAA